MRVLLHTGKGGVGKTTLALATAFGAARHGHRVCVLSTDPAHSLADALGEKVGPSARRISDGVFAREIRAQVELDRAWSSIQAWLRELIRDEADALVAEELLAFPDDAVHHGLTDLQEDDLKSEAAPAAAPAAVAFFQKMPSTIAGKKLLAASPKAKATTWATNPGG